MLGQYFFKLKHLTMIRESHAFQISDRKFKVDLEKDSCGCQPRQISTRRKANMEREPWQG
jgi:hypothetical protein